MKAILSLAVLLICVCACNAWASTGHLVTSTIAYNDLMKNNKWALDKANDILEPLRKFFMESAYPFIAAAEWPDDIKGQGWKSFNNLHFLNYAVIDPDFHEDISTSVDNATYAHNQCFNVITKSTGKISTIGKSLCMRFLIHLIGDIHQPLHTATLFSTLFPNGDMGGNMFQITYPAKKSLNELHAYWDSTANNYSASIQVPITDNYFTKLQDISTGITAKWTREALKEELKLQTFDQWVTESGKHAYETAYDALKLKSGDTITPEYEQKARQLIDHQLALGGYRLADTIVKMMSTQADSLVAKLLEAVQE